MKKCLLNQVSFPFPLFADDNNVTLQLDEQFYFLCRCLNKILTFAMSACVMSLCLFRSAILRHIKIFNDLNFIDSFHFLAFKQCKFSLNNYALLNFVFRGLTKFLPRVPCTPQQLRLSTNILIKLMKLKNHNKILKLTSVVCYFAFH